MKRIASFEVNHDGLAPGMYTSRVDGDVITYDIRIVRPNGGVYIAPAAAHTFEHLFATYARNSRFAESIIYCGPMGCQTGFYLLVRDMKPEDAIVLTQQTMDFVASYAGDVPGVSRAECGNYLLHDLDEAKKLAQSMQPVLRGWTREQLSYEKA